MESEPKVGARGGPHLGSWTWCIFVHLLCLPCVFSKCGDSSISVRLHPPEDQILLYGKQSLELYCIAEDGYSADDLQFKLGLTNLTADKVNGTTIKLTIKNPEIQANTYFCKNIKTKKECTSRVLVDTLPRPVTNFKCISKNLNQINCSWPIPRYILGINYSIYFWADGIKLNANNATKIGNMAYCVWSELTHPYYRQQVAYYNFNLRSGNALGYIEQNFTIDHFSVVKPDRPINLTVVNKTAHSATLQWTVPYNMVDLLGGGLDHKIGYQIAEIDNTDYFHYVDTSILPGKSSTYTFELADLPYANKQYEVRVYIRPKKAKEEMFWSDYAYTFLLTASEIPQRPPDMTAGCFYQSTYEDKRMIKVYWSQLEEYEEAGANFTYKVVISQGSKSETILSENKSLSYVTLQNASREAFHVMVWSSNAVGTSVNSSYLYIPHKEDTDSLTVTSFTKLAYKNGTYELSWKRIHNIDNYTLFWCELNTTTPCSGHMNFTTISPHRKNFVINLPRQNYQFAISANNGTKSSGMNWAKCNIPKEEIGLYEIPMSLSYSDISTTHVKLKWMPECSLPDGFVEGYKIVYCPTIETSNKCDPMVGNTTINITDPKQLEAEINGLLPYRTHQFSISMKTIHGISLWNNSVPLTTLEDTPGPPTNVKVYNITSNSLVISWGAPIQKNGKIGVYQINQYSEYENVRTYSIVASTYFKMVPDLRGFTNYTFTVQACSYTVKPPCSTVTHNDRIHVRTAIGHPNKISIPVYNSSVGAIVWQAPGAVDRYQVKIQKDGREDIIQNTTDLSMEITKQCEGTPESYQVRAMNFDQDLYHGVSGDSRYVFIDKRDNEDLVEYIGEWSDPYSRSCGESEGITVTLIIMGIVTVAGVAYGSLKLHKKLKQMEDIKPVFPNSLGVPEKDPTKYSFGNWNHTNKDEKPSSDEMLLLPNSKIVSSAPTSIKQDHVDNCDASDHTDSTALSNNSQGPIDRQVSLSDNSSDSSLNMEIEDIKRKINSDPQESESSQTDSECSRENSPYLSNQDFKKNTSTGYVQSVISPVPMTAPAAFKSPHLQPKAPTQPASTSYVMAGLSPPIFTTGLMPAGVSNLPLSSGYVRAEDAQARSMNFPKLGPSPTKLFGPESLPIMPNLPPPSKAEADSSYIQLQSLDSLPNRKQTAPMPAKASNGYVSPTDAVLSKHLTNMLAAAQPPDEPVVLDPAMSPDAYCRFSWSTDPAIENFNSFLADPSTIDPTKN